jgi:hypothetical protein
MSESALVADPDEFFWTETLSRWILSLIFLVKVSV